MIIGISTNNCKNLVIKLRLRNKPLKKYLFSNKRYMLNRAKNVEGIPVRIVELWKRKVGLKARNNAANSAVFSLNTFFPIR